MLSEVDLRACIAAAALDIDDHAYRQIFGVPVDESKTVSLDKTGE